MPGDKQSLSNGHVGMPLTDEFIYLFLGNGLIKRGTQDKGQRRNFFVEEPVFKSFREGDRVAKSKGVLTNISFINNTG